MTAAGERPQDAGRRHRRKGAPSAATSSLLAEYQDAMRAELRALLAEIAGAPAPAGLLDSPENPPPTVRPSLIERGRLWDLAIKLGRELGSAVDAELAAPATPAARAAPRPRGRVDYG